MPGPATEVRRAAENFFFKALSSPVEKACRLLLVFVAAPALGVASFGAFQFASTVTGLLTVCTEFGLGTWTTRAIARDAQRASRVVAVGLRFRVAAVVPYLLLAGSFAFAQAPGEPRRVFALLGIAALASAFVDYFGAILRGYEDFRREAVVNALRGVLTLAGALGALHTRCSLAGFSGGLTAGAVASAALGLFLLREHGPMRAGNGEAGLNGSAARVAIRDAIPIWLAGLLSTLYFRSDVVFVRYFCGDPEVGAYGAAYRVFEASTLLPSTIMAVAFPRLARAHRTSQRHPLTGLEGRLVALLAILGTITGIVMYVASARFTGWVFGSGFARSAVSLRVLALDVPVLFVNFALAPFLIARGRERRYLVFAALMLGVNVSVNLVLIPRLGGPGAAWATLATDLALAMVCFAVLGVGRTPRPSLS